MTRYSIRRPILALIILTGVNLLCFGLLNPLDSPTFVLFMAFAVLALDFFVLYYVLVRVSQKVFGHPKHSARRLGAALTGVTIILVALQSVGQLSVRDTVAVFLVCSIAYFYYSRVILRP